MTAPTTAPTMTTTIGRIALVTGATRGIGRAVALAYARAGYHVIATGRTQGALTELDDEIRAATGRADAATLVTLNLKHLDKVDALGPSIYSRFGKLDVVAACAGVLGTLTPIGHLQAETWEEAILINLTANMRLIRTLDPLLKLSEAGRAIFVTSGAASGKNAYWGAYAASKAGLDALVRTYANEVANTTVRANLLSPGPVRTKMREKAFPGEDPMTLKTPEDIAPAFLRLAAPDLAENGQTFDVKTGGWLA